MSTPERDEDLALYVISVASELSGLHPQTLRQYDRLGLVSPSRAQGRGRRYSLRDIALLRNVSMSHMAIEVAKLRIEVDALLESNPEKALVARRRTDVIVYNSKKSL